MSASCAPQQDAELASGFRGAVLATRAAPDAEQHVATFESCKAARRLAPPSPWRERAANPHLMSLRGVGPNTAAQLLMSARGDPDWLRTEASFAALCGTAPVPASAGKTAGVGGAREAVSVCVHVFEAAATSRAADTNDSTVGVASPGRRASDTTAGSASVTGT